MKGRHKGNRNPYTDQRDMELISAFRKAKKHLLDTKGYIILQEAVEIARNSPCSRYFVSEQRASIVIKQMLVFDEYIKSLSENPHAETDRSKIPVDALENMIYQKRRLFSHLFVVYKSLREQYPDYNHEELVTVACASPADEFYLSQASALEILSKIRINAYKKHGYTSNRKLSNVQ